MRKRELAAEVSTKVGVSARVVSRVLAAMVELQLQEIARAGRLEWRGLGTFTVREYGARKIHNPQTGRVMALKARKGVTFKPGRKLRSLIARPQRPRKPRPGGAGRESTRPPTWELGNPKSA